MKYIPLPGIYLIFCTINKKAYIGSSKSIKKRWNSHRDWLARNKHSNEHLQRAYNKYGKDSFVYSILEKCSETELIEKENIWMNKYESLDPSKGFNKVPAGQYPGGFSITSPLRKEVYVYCISPESTILATRSSLIKEDIIGQGKLGSVLSYWKNYHNGVIKGIKSYKGVIYIRRDDYVPGTDYLKLLSERQWLQPKRTEDPEYMKEYRSKYEKERWAKIKASRNKDL